MKDKYTAEQLVTAMRYFPCGGTNFGPIFDDATKLIATVAEFKKAKKTVVDPYVNYLKQYQMQFKVATNLYKSVIEMTLKDEPYKIPSNQLDISYISAFELDELRCKYRDWETL